MHEYSPLRALELRVIEESLNSKDLEKAQVLLGQVGTQPDLQTGVAYLATRLLFLKGRLDAASVVERMRELVGANPQFSEARNLMEHCTRLLRASGSEPPPPITPRPGSLFPSAPPSAGPSGTADTAVFNVSPLAQLELDAFSESDDAPESWPVPGFERAAQAQDEDRPTFVPEPTLPEIPSDETYPADSLAQTEYPKTGPEGEERRPSSSSPLRRPSSSGRLRQIQVDTRDSLMPKAPSIPPPSRYDPNIPKPEGRYSVHDSDDEVVVPPARPVPSGRYRLTHPMVEEVIPSSLKARGKRDPQVVSSHPPRSPREAVAPPPVSSNPPGTLPSASKVSATAPTDEHIAIDVIDEPTPFRVPRPSSGAPPSSQDPPSSYAWNDPERQFTRGDSTAARARFEQKALELLEPYPTDFDAFPDKVSDIVALLSATPVIHYFAPFDRSLCSLPRIELAIRTLYAGASSLPLASVRPILALYVGEVLRVSHRGNWRGVAERPSTWAVEAGAHIWQPLRCIAQVLSDNPGQALLQSVGTGLAKRGTLAWMAASALSPPLGRPWHDPLTPQKQADLGLWVAHSPWSACCERWFGQPLDGSLHSLKVLDRLLDFLCDSADSPKANEPWLVRTATLAGAYVGYVLTSNANAHWVERSSNTEQGIALELPGGIIATPVANVVARATSRKRSQLADYVRALLRRAL